MGCPSDGSVGSSRRGESQGGVDHSAPTTGWTTGVVQIYPISPFGIVTRWVGLVHLAISPQCKIKSCWEWCLRTEEIMGLLMMSDGTRSETGQIPGPWLKCLKGVKIQDFKCLYPLPLGSGRLHGWERGLFLKRRITALQGVVGHFAPTFG